MLPVAPAHSDDPSEYPQSDCVSKMTVSETGRAMHGKHMPLASSSSSRVKEMSSICVYKERRGGVFCERLCVSASQKNQSKKTPPFFSQLTSLWSTSPSTTRATHAPQMPARHV